MPSEGPPLTDPQGAPPDPPEADQAAVRDLLVEYEKVRTQYRNMPIAMVGSSVIATLMGAALAKGVEPWKVLVWMGSVYAWTIGRFFQWRAFERIDPGPEAIGPWRNYAILGSLLAGIIWGVGAVVM